MEYVEVQGASVPKIGLGTAQLTGQRCQEVVHRALRMGYRHIDTAPAYGNEAKIGAAIAATGVPREEVFVTTKVGFESLGRDDTVRAAHESLRRLALDYIDCLLVHWPNEQIALGETLEAMMRLRDEGTILHIGVSNFTPSFLEEALSIAPILCNEVEFHPFLAQDQMLALCERHDLLLLAYSPLARGRAASDPTLEEIGRAHGRSAAQTTLRWLTQHKNVAAIPKASSPEHLRENLDVLDFEVDAGEANRIAALDRGQRLVDPDWAPRWGT